MYLYIGGSIQDNHSTVPNQNNTYSHPMFAMGPAAVSTLQRKPNEGGNENALKRSLKPFEQSSNASNQNMQTSNVIIGASENGASKNSEFIPPINNLAASATSGTMLQNNTIHGNEFKNTTTASSTTSSTIESPKQQKKLKHLIFSGKNLKKLVSKHKDSDSATYQGGVSGKIKDSDGSSNENNTSDSVSKRNAAARAQAAMDDRHRRKFFSHHDISSLCASLGGTAHAARAKEALERRNTTTGASAASAALRSSNTSGNDSTIDSPDVDHGDNVSNELVLR